MEYYARPFSRVRASPVAILRKSFPLTPETEEAVTPSVSRIGIGATVLPINRGVEGRRQRSTLDLDGGKGLVDFAQVFGRQPEIGGGQVVIQVFDFVAPGIGTIHCFCASSQASAICAGMLIAVACLILRSRAIGKPSR